VGVDVNTRFCHHGKIIFTVNRIIFILSGIFPPPSFRAFFNELVYETADVKIPDFAGEKK
jgi:hypothetical protein